MPGGVVRGLLKWQEPPEDGSATQVHHSLRKRQQPEGVGAGYPQLNNCQPRWTMTLAKAIVEAFFGCANRSGGGMGRVSASLTIASMLRLGSRLAASFALIWNAVCQLPSTKWPPCGERYTFPARACRGATSEKTSLVDRRRQADMRGLATS